MAPVGQGVQGSRPDSSFYGMPLLFVNGTLRDYLLGPDNRPDAVSTGNDKVIIKFNLRGSPQGPPSLLPPTPPLLPPHHKFPGHPTLLWTVGVKANKLPATCLHSVLCLENFSHPCLH